MNRVGRKAVESSQPIQATLSWRRPLDGMSGHHKPAANAQAGTGVRNAGNAAHGSPGESSEAGVPYQARCSQSDSETRNVAPSSMPSSHDLPADRLLAILPISTMRNALAIVARSIACSILISPASSVVVGRRRQGTKRYLQQPRAANAGRVVALTRMSYRHPSQAATQTDVAFAKYANVSDL